jgi:GNAT superfamily N-acetyltransferase
MQHCLAPRTLDLDARPRAFIGGTAGAAISAGAPLIAQLGPSHRPLVERHLLALPPADRRLRFGHPAGDASLRQYARRIRFYRDAGFGAFDESGRLLAFGHLAFTADDAELALSVDPAARRRGIGIALLLRARAHARNRGYRVLHMVYMPENDSLASLARRAGMRLVADPVECRAYLALETPTAESLLGEAAHEALAALDLGFRRIGATSA